MNGVEKKKGVKPYDPRAIYEGLISKAPFLPGDNGLIVDVDKVEWYDLELVKEGQDFIWRNFWAELLVMVAGLVLGVTFKSVTTALLRNPGYSSKENSKRRNAETAVHVRNWLYGLNLFTPGDLAFKDFQQVRRLHVIALRQCEKTPLILTEDGIRNKVEKLKIIDALQKDLAFLDLSSAPHHLFTYDPAVLFSQFDMAMVLFSMYAPIYLYPANIGLRDTRGMEGFLHFWAVVGKSLGIEDEFNLALYADKDLQGKVVENILLPCVKNLDLTMLEMGDVYLESIKNTPFGGWWASYPLFLYTGLRQMPLLKGKFKGHHLYALMSWTEVIISKLAGLAPYLLYYVPILGKVLNFDIHRRHRNELRKYGLKENNNDTSAES